MSATGKSDERGFTLIELLVVLGVLALLSGIGFPVVERAIAQQQFRLAVAEIETALHAARSAAIARDDKVRFEASAVPREVRLELPQGGLMFFPDGSATGGTIAITAGPRVARFRVDAATGRIESP